MKKLAAYRANNTEDKTILNFFDEIELHPKQLSAEEPLPNLLHLIQEWVGPVRNYGLSFEEIEAKAKLDEEYKVRNACCD